MQLRCVKGNTWVLEDTQLLGLYRLPENRCILLDSGSGKLRGALVAALEEAHLTPAAVLCTHMHYDHHENTRFFRKQYGAVTCLPQLEADIVRSPASLKNHLFNFPAGMIRSVPRLEDLVCPVDRVIGLEETSVSLAGADFSIVHTPGHSPDHICILTPDNVCYGGDVLMTEEVLDQAMLPFVFDMTDDLESKKRLKELPCDTWIFSHCGVVQGDITRLVDENIRHIRRQLHACADLVTAPMTYSEFYATVVEAFDLPVGHPARALHLERYIRPYLEYLIDAKRLEILSLGGAPAVGPQEDYR